MEICLNVNRGIAHGAKVCELCDETFNEFSDAPFEFENTTLDLWQDTQRVYYHACIANRFSDNYLLYCKQLEKNIRELGSFCLTKAVLEQKGLTFSKLTDLSIHELICMVSFHYRKAHAALEGVYTDNNILAITYLNWEFRWVGLGNRLKATEVKIQKILSNELQINSVLEKAEIFSGIPCTNISADTNSPQNIHVNPSALPVKSSIVRRMLNDEKAEEETAKQIQKEQESKLRRSDRHEQQSIRFYSSFQPPKPFTPDKEMMNAAHLEETEALRREVEEQRNLEKKPRQPVPEKQATSKTDPKPEQLNEAESRKMLIEDTLERKNQDAIMAIPLYDTNALHEYWEQFLDMLEGRPRHRTKDPPQNERKDSREKRKKKKRK